MSSMFPNRVYVAVAARSRSDGLAPRAGKCTVASPRGPLMPPPPVPPVPGREQLATCEKLFACNSSQCLSDVHAYDSTGTYSICECHC
jgi:hypothetical protein